jgi:hypothetical protein
MSMSGRSDGRLVQMAVSRCIYSVAGCSQSWEKESPDAQGSSRSHCLRFDHERKWTLWVLLTKLWKLVWPERAQPCTLLRWPHRERPSSQPTASFWNAAEGRKGKQKFQVFSYVGGRRRRASPVAVILMQHHGLGSGVVGGEVRKEEAGNCRWMESATVRNHRCLTQIICKHPTACHEARAD